MSTQIKCRAKNPSTCRVHGSVSPISLLYNPKQAYQNVLESQKTVNLASNLEELSEAKQLVAHDEIVYYSTLKGKADLMTAYWAAKQSGSYQNELQTLAKIQESQEYRNKVLSENPAYIESENNFNGFVKQYAEESYVIKSEAQRDEVFEKLKNLPYGTPIAIKTKNNGFIYDGAGNGYTDGKVSKIATKLLGLKPSFTSSLDGKSGAEAISLQHSHVALYTTQVDEIHVLKPEAANVYGTVSNTNESVFGQNIGTNSSSERVVVAGKGYRYEVEGKFQDFSENDTKRLDIKGGPLEHFTFHEPGYVAQVKMF